MKFKLYTDIKIGRINGIYRFKSSTPVIYSAHKNVKMTTIVGILTFESFMSRTNSFYFGMNRSEHEKT